MMRRTPITLTAGAAALALAGLALPAAAQAAVVAAAKVPAPQNSSFVAGYDQMGCLKNGYPVYIEISGTIVVPTATDIDGTPGISADVYDLGGIGSGVTGGVSLDNSGGQAFYVAYAQWGDGAPATAFSVQPGDKLEVTIEDEGSSGWLVEIFDGASGQEWSQVNPDTSASRCVAGAYEQSDYPVYDHLTQTTPVAFDFTRVWWGEQGQGVATVSKLLGTPPAHAKLQRFTLVNSGGNAMAVTSKPTDSNNNFTITDK
jgi:hypothetical protein